MELATVTETRRLESPAVTPQALTWDGKHLWIGSRDLRQVYKIDIDSWKVLEEFEAPGIPWAAVAMNGELRFTIGEGAEDDRYVYRYTAETGFVKLFVCPDFTGSYLSTDGEHLYLSQWHKQRILKFDAAGEVIRKIDIGAEICGHTFADGLIYVLRGQEKPDEDWRIAVLDPQQSVPTVKDVAQVPFASRSLTFDGQNFWSNHRAANQIVSFVLPG
ncbi:MAG: YncE family protein [Chthoniobacterales bacterium]